MERDEGSLERWPGGGTSALAERDHPDPLPEWADLRAWGRWAERHGLVLAGTVAIVLSLAWKVEFLGHLYFRQDDFRLIDRALVDPLSWKELTYIGAGHLIPGPYLISWLVTRVSSPYDWGLASAVTLAFVAAASFAGLRLFRTLFGDRPAILIPLLVYLVCPLTLPDIGIWSSALESVPLQLAIFMAMTAHVRYVRSGRTGYLVSSACWVAFGLFFFEKGLILPLLLFAVTAGFLMGDGSWLAGARRCAVGYWRAWLLYLVLTAGYAIVLKVSLPTSVAQPHTPHSAGRVLAFAWGLLRETFVPGAIGGPWHWFPLTGSSYSFAAPPIALEWMALIGGALFILFSSLRRRIAWRAWAILGGWLLAADMMPVIIGRLNEFSPSLLGLETRYVADAVPVLALSIGLAFWPVARPSPAAQAAAGARTPGQAPSHSPRAAGPGQPGQFGRTATAVVLGTFMLCSLWSVQAYQNVTSGGIARSFIAEARLALKEAPRGTVVVDDLVPSGIVLGSFRHWAHASTVIGAMALHEPAARLRWIDKPVGTVDDLLMFGADGRLYPAKMFAMVSPPRSAGRNCWAKRAGAIRVPFYGASPAGTELVRIGYLWYSSHPGLVTLRYGRVVKQLRVEPGLHSAYLPEHGSARSVAISGFGPIRLCVGDAEAGILVPSTSGRAIPAVP